MAGLERVPVVVRDVTPSESLELALIENIQRKDLNPIEEALACRKLMEDTGSTQEILSRRLGKGSLYHRQPVTTPETAQGYSARRD